MSSSPPVADRIRHPRHVLGGAVVAALIVGLGLGLDVAVGEDDFRGVAAPPPVGESPREVPDVAPPGKGAATTLYSHGEPTVDEQLFLELMNRARSDPATEGARVANDYGNPQVKAEVDFFLRSNPGERTRGENRAEFESYPAQPPFAFNAALLDAARGHTLVMRREDSQTHQHVASGELAPRDRLVAAGYTPNGSGESVYAFGRSIVHMHAAFAVDWGQALPTQSQRLSDPQLPPGRPYPGHRLVLMNPTDVARRDYVEVGVGILPDSDPTTGVGPLLVTVDFAIPADASTRFVTGVCFDDLDDDGFYDRSEGLAGVRIETDRSDFYTVSSASGGYALPIDAFAGATTVTATGPGVGAGSVVGTQTRVVTLAGDNVKVDFNAAPTPERPRVHEVSVLPGESVSGTEREFVLPVAPIQDESELLSDLDVLVQVAHPDRTELELELVSPSGTVISLLADPPPGSDLRGSFDGTLTPDVSPAELAGESYVGEWRLRVRDAPGGSSATVEGFGLALRPEWVRPLAAPRNPLFVPKLRVKRARKAGRDRVDFVAEVEPAGGSLDGAGVRLRLLDDADGALVLDVDPERPETLPEGTRLRAAVRTDHRDTSRTKVKLRLDRLTLVRVPERARVELTVGDSVLRDVLPLDRGRFKGKRDVSERPGLRVDKLVSRTTGLETVTKVRGTFTPVTDPAAFDLDGGFVDVLVGDFGVSRPVGVLERNGDRRVLRAKDGLEKLMVDPVRGVFVIKIRTRHRALVDGVVPVALRVGAFYRDTEVRPAVKGTTLRY